jgi:hypothetical protein
MKNIKFHSNDGGRADAGFKGDAGLAQLFVPLLNVPANSNQKETNDD